MKKVTQKNLRIIQKPYAHLQTRQFQKNWHYTVGGVDFTRLLTALSGKTCLSLKEII